MMEKIATKDFIDRWNYISILAKEEREKRLAETPGVVIPSKFEFNDLVMNTLVNHNNKIDLLQSINEYWDFIKYEQNKILESIKTPYIENNYKCDVIANLVMIKKALDCNELETKYIILAKAKKYVKHILEKYKKVFNDDSIINNEVLKKDILHLIK